MKKAQSVILIIFMLFVCFTVGFFCGSNSTHKGLCVIAENTLTGPTDAVSNTDPDTIGKIDINNATASQLQLLPGIGEVLASRIINYRNENGKFQSIDDLLLVDGIGNARIESIRQYITVGG